MHTNRQHKHYMAIALGLAMRGQGQCSPNPAVGAVIVKNNRIISSGWHKGPGQPHAEIVAIEKATSSLHGATIYVTLEPCCHYGRTPPCTEAIIKAGILTVYYGYLDPNHLVRGKGIDMLTSTKINCIPITIPAVTAFYAPYHHWHTHNQASLISKIAIFEDGSYAQSDGQPLSITGTLCKQLTFAGRAKADALITTATTISNDNPHLNIRIGTKVRTKPLIIIDRFLKTSLSNQVFQSGNVIVPYDPRYISAIKSNILPTTIKYHAFDFGPLHAPIPWKKLKQYLGRLGLQRIWFEGGGKSVDSQIQEQAVDRLMLYVHRTQPPTPNNLTLKNTLHNNSLILQCQLYYDVDHIFYFTKKD